jgi:hypothetical protein
MGHIYPMRKMWGDWTKKRHWKMDSVRVKRRTKFCEKKVWESCMVEIVHNLGKNKKTRKRVCKIEHKRGWAWKLNIIWHSTVCRMWVWHLKVGDEWSISIKISEILKILIRICKGLKIIQGFEVLYKVNPGLWHVNPIQQLTPYRFIFSLQSQ